ncbi:hypothetical protein LJC42_05480 [Eubacteriales bacterium OttesenSCG-928-K08]|nr:hypothetical protein [Eubacteriales bacterium OttesenSCG-928-K08]
MRNRVFAFCFLILAVIISGCYTYDSDERITDYSSHYSQSDNPQTVMLDGISFELPSDFLVSDKADGDYINFSRYKYGSYSKGSIYAKYDYEMDIDKSSQMYDFACFLIRARYKYLDVICEEYVTIGTPEKEAFYISYSGTEKTEEEMLGKKYRRRPKNESWWNKGVIIIEGYIFIDADGVYYLEMSYPKHNGQDYESMSEQIFESIKFAKNPSEDSATAP